MKEVVVQVEGVEKSFGNKKIIQHLNFEIEKGDVFGFLGPNGAGKTTTIRMLLGLLKADKGNIYINGINLKTNFREAIRGVGALVEGPAFYEYMTAEENLQIFSSYNRANNKLDIQNILKKVGLEGREKEKVKTYSLGMKQRLGIAQALLDHPNLLILDEPTNGLDPQGIKEIRYLIGELSKQGITILISSHILTEIEQCCNKVLIINKGEKVIDGLTQELISQRNRYDITTLDSEKLINFLKTIKGISIEHEGTDIRIKLEKGIKPEELLTDIIQQKIRITKYSPFHQTVEDYFFSVM